MAELAHEPFTFRDLESVGLTRRRLEQHLRDGAIRRILHGVYIAADVPDTPESRAAALKLVMKPEHVVVDRSAAWLHGIDAYAFGELEAVPDLETCVHRFRHPTRRDGTRGRTRTLLPRDIATVHDIPVTTPLRTSLDLACHLRRRDAKAVLDQFARLHQVTRGDLGREIRRFAGRRGVIQGRELINIVDGRIESPRESWVDLEIYDNQLPKPVPQYWIVIDGVPTYRLDFAYPHARVCVEYDGVEAHELTHEQREHDQARRQWLRDHGWIVIVVRKGDFTGDRPDRWIDEIWNALRPAFSTRRW